MPVDQIIPVSVSRLTDPEHTLGFFDHVHIFIRCSQIRFSSICRQKEIFAIARLYPGTHSIAHNRFCIVIAIVKGTGDISSGCYKNGLLVSNGKEITAVFINIKGSIKAAKLCGHNDISIPVNDSVTIITGNHRVFAIEASDRIAGLLLQGIFQRIVIVIITEMVQGIRGLYGIEGRIIGGDHTASRLDIDIIRAGFRIVKIISSQGSDTLGSLVSYVVNVCMIDEIIIGIVRIIILVFRTAFCQDHTYRPHVSYDFYSVILEIYNNRTVRCKNTGFSGAIIELGYDITFSAHHILTVNGFCEKISIQIHQGVRTVQILVFNDICSGNKSICLYTACCGQTCFTGEYLDRLCGSVRYGNAAGSIDDCIVAPDLIIGPKKNTVARQNLLFCNRCKGIGDRIVNTAACCHVIGDTLQGRLHLSIIIIHLAELVAEIIQLRLFHFTKLCRCFFALICCCLCCRSLRHTDHIVHDLVNVLFFCDLISDNVDLNVIDHKGCLILSYRVSNASCRDELHVCQFLLAFFQLDSAGFLIRHHNARQSAGTGNFKGSRCQDLTVINTGGG